jgi:glycosyltransferase involved in cell wall biosynthesis
MKIAIVQGAFLPVPPIMGGAVEKMWYLLGQKFAARGHEVVHVSKKWTGLPDHECVQGVTYRRIAGHNAPVNQAYYKILDGIYSLRAIGAVPDDTDIVVTNTFWTPLFLPLFKKAKVVVDVARMPKGQMRLYRAAARLRANSTPVTTAICDELPAHRHVQVGMIPNPLPYHATDAMELGSKERNILFCGRVHPEKGLELLANATNALPAGWTLTIVGPWQTAAGGGGAAYLQTLKALFDSAKVRFVEPIYDIEKLNVLYRAAAIFVYPSVAEKGETFGLAPLEAMAWGAVPVVSDLACFKDFIHDGENGLIFNHRLPDASVQVAACIARLIEDPTLRLRLGEQALQVRTSHSPDAIADLFLADFERLAA